MDETLENARKQRLTREALGGEPGADDEVYPIVTIVAFVLLFAVIVTPF